MLGAAGGRQAPTPGFVDPLHGSSISVPGAMDELDPALIFVLIPNPCKPWDAARLALIWPWVQLEPGTTRGESGNRHVAEPQHWQISCCSLWLWHPASEEGEWCWIIPCQD